MEGRGIGREGDQKGGRREGKEGNGREEDGWGRKDRGAK